MDSTALFEPLRLGALQLPNRVVMAPLTRMRAGEGAAPTPLNALYYAQRAGVGLIITEATGISPEARGYPDMPGLYTPRQIAGWRAVTGEVQRRGGRIVAQIVHHGRWSHSSYSPEGRLPVAPSAVAPTVGQAFTPSWAFVPFETPRALALDELPGIVALFRQAALNAMAAGFDAVEVHGANGFLLDQFLQDGCNQRSDAYGGAFEKRTRLLLEVIDAVAEAIGADRLALRLSPHGNLGGLSDADPVGLFTHVISTLNSWHLAYLHLVEPRAASAGLGDDASIDAADNAALFRRAFHGPMISAGGYTRETAIAAITEGRADAIAFGRQFIANPDLAERFRQGAPLNQYDRSSFYGGGAKGYTDYPTL